MLTLGKLISLEKYYGRCHVSPVLGEKLALARPNSKMKIISKERKKETERRKKRESWKTLSYVAFSRIPQILEVKTFYGNEERAIRRRVQILKKRQEWRAHCEENERDGDTKEPRLSQLSTSLSSSVSLGILFLFSQTPANHFAGKRRCFR